jgi:hypothetical protein
LLIVATVAVLSVVILFMVRPHDGDNNPADNADLTGGPPARRHDLSEAPRADFISIFVYDANGGVSSFMVGGRTEEFNSFTVALKDAAPVSESEDSSFSDLLVLSFGDSDTMELPYSRSRNLMMFEDRIYRPSANLAPLIAVVEKRLT